MLKYVFLAGAMTVAVPVAAQTADSPAMSSPDQTQTAPMSQPMPDSATTTAPAQSAPMDSAAAPTQAAPAQSAPAQTAAQPAATATQVAQVVDSEFPTYDADKDGKLSATEFSAWMVALKSKADPSTKAGAPETKKWVDAAFAQADTDKSKSLTKAELTGFLSQGQS